MIHRRFIHFDIGVKEKLQNTPLIEMDFVSILPCVNGSTIQLVLRELLLSINSKLKIYKKLFFSHRCVFFSYITLVQNTIIRLQHPS